MTLEERLDKARSLRGQGYNCAQSVCASFPDVMGMPEEDILRLSIGFGGGVGGCGEVCGVLSAMAMLEGMRTQGTPADKRQAYGNTKRLRDTFAGEFGSAVCRELKAPGKAVPCNDLIYRGIEMYHAHLEESGL